MSWLSELGRRWRTPGPTMLYCNACFTLYERDSAHLCEQEGRTNWLPGGAGVAVDPGKRARSYRVR